MKGLQIMSVSTHSTSSSPSFMLKIKWLQCEAMAMAMEWREAVRKTYLVGDRRPHSVEPTPLVLRPRSRERRARHLLSVETIGTLFGVVSLGRKRTLNRFGRDVITEA